MANSRTRRRKANASRRDGPEKDLLEKGKTEPEKRGTISLGKGRSMPDKTGSTGSGGSGRGAKTMGNIFDALMIGNVSAVPEPDLYATATGRRVGTELYRDRGFPIKLAVIQPSATFQFEGAGKSHWFQSSTVVDDTVVDTVLGPFMTQTYNYIVRELASHRGRLFAIRDTTLANSGAFNSFPAWLDCYAAAFGILRALQSCLGSSDFNYTMSLIAAAVNQSLPRLLADLDRLLAFAVPEKFVTLLDALVGVKAYDADSPCYIGGIPITSVPLDLTLNASIVTLLIVAEANLNALLTGAGGAAAFAAADAQAISNIMGYAYGDLKLPLEKGISYDLCEFAIQMFQGMSFNNTTGAVTYTWPNVNAALPQVNTVPIIIPKDYSGPCLGYYLSLLRPCVYSIDPLAGTVNTAGPNQVGISYNSVLNGTTNSSRFGAYGQNGVFSSISPAFAGVFGYGFGDPSVNAFPWLGEAGAQSTDYSADARIFSGYDRVWFPRDWFIDETVYQWEEIWLDPLRREGGAAY